MPNNRPTLPILLMVPITNLALIICATIWCLRLDERTQRGLSYALVDEVDSILIDEARTPLIISGQAEDSIDLYSQINAVALQLTAQKEEEALAIIGWMKKRKPSP